MAFKDGSTGAWRPAGGVGGLVASLACLCFLLISTMPAATGAHAPPKPSAPPESRLTAQTDTEVKCAGDAEAGLLRAAGPAGKKGQQGQQGEDGQGHTEGGGVRGSVAGVEAGDEEDGCGRQCAHVDQPLLSCSEGEGGVAGQGGNEGWRASWDQRRGGDARSQGILSVQCGRGGQSAGGAGCGGEHSAHSLVVVGVCVTLVTNPVVVHSLEVSVHPFFLDFITRLSICLSTFVRCSAACALPCCLGAIEKDSARLCYTFWLV